jgi:hypothetical protein
MPMHRIGLSQAWERLAPVRGDAVWIRRFGRSGQLDPNERVHLVVEGVSLPLTLRLNDGPEEHVPAGTSRWAREFTDRWGERNDLIVAFAGPTPVDATVRRSPFPEDVARIWIEIESGT